ncbi:AAA family ATPase [Rheinheimera sp. 4Y26]|uniref:AAA family ATPase n=1 Tax=Rheinheimera sp. 4Y26 TaxID=2977811 RepID=UPI0021B09F7A|nr:ATP-binding protein [Rheinheimera sp. 4Y26]MCT6700884.1 ATP-binding protein [Rheinheimera sp. 4Y26]
MLVCFRAENFRSICDPIELNLRPAPRLRNHKSHVVQPIKSNLDLKVLKTSLIYGANASGKSNIVKAIDFVQNLITSSKASDEKIDFTPFKVTKTPKESASFYIEFTIDSFHLALTFEVNKDRILYERLSYIEKNREKIIYERKSDKDFHEFNSDIITDSETLNFISALSKYAPENTSIINFVSQNGKIQKDLPQNFTSYLRAAFFYFKYCLVIVFPNSRYGGLTDDVQDGTINSYTANIKDFDTGIDSLNIEKVESSLFSPSLINKIKKEIEILDQPIKFENNFREYTATKNGDEIDIHEIILKHKDIHGNQFDFSTSEESDGTVRLLDLIPVLSNSEALKNVLKPTFIVDEFDRSLHPNLSKLFLEKFLSTDTHAGQFIVTTHQSELLDLKLIRRDEIWFAQKEWNQSTSLYSLNDYSTRHDKDIRSAYLNGLFGAIPIVERTSNE